MTTPPTNHELAERALESAMRNFENGRILNVNIDLAAAAIRALLAIAQSIDQAGERISESLPMAGRGN